MKKPEEKTETNLVKKVLKTGRHCWGRESMKRRLGASNRRTCGDQAGYVRRMLASKE